MTLTQPHRQRTDDPTTDQPDNWVTDQPDDQYTTTGANR